jgi:predicted alpha-1,2-mannosidase
MKLLLSTILSILIMTSLFAQTKLINYVNPMIGTDDMGHTYPGATVPFGMVQLSPETDTILYSLGQGYNKDVYRYCAGYQYKDNTIVGFSHTHFSGTGHSDLGDFLIMPTTGELKLNPGTKDNPDSGYRSRFSHDKEKSSPGYYSVYLDDYKIKTELTTTTRVGFHKYTFNEASSANIILDMISGIYDYDGKVVWSSIRVENDTLITGYRQTRGWARTKYLYFAMTFSKPIKKYGYKNDEQIVYNGFYRKFNEFENFPEMAGKKVRAYFNFDMNKNESLQIKFALSAVSTEGALKNLSAEIPHWNFDQTKSEAEQMWENELSKIKVETNDEKKRIFYTALYHSFLGPTVYMDVDGCYRGLDQNIHKAENFTNYTTFSLWDTYRALHPLFTIVQQQRTGDMINSMLAHQQQSVHKILPVWSHHANENWCMIGYHSVPVIVDAYMKGIKSFNLNDALSACVMSATYGKYDGIDSYMDYGFVPMDLNSNAASKTLEYAYDDWTIYKLADIAGNNHIKDVFKKRANSFSQLFDEKIKFIRPKNSDGTWFSPFDPMSTERQGFIEGNSWNYSLYVPHDVNRLINLYGGNENFISHLDSLFNMGFDEEHFQHSEDISAAGILGGYVHGNEPSHHVPYLYNYAGAPWKTQEKVNEIVNKFYRNAVDGLCGNDDCGQMSAWYIFSVMGFYPVCPGSNEYVIGTPGLSKANINLENGKSFIITANNLSEKNIYIQSITLNGKKYEKLFIRHEDIMNGGELIFEMSSTPNKKLGQTKNVLPYSMSGEK